MVLLVDIGKGSLAAGVGLALDGHRGAYLLGLAAVLGHVFPIIQRFRGGRGVATAGGVMIVIYPLIALVLAVVWFLIARVLRKASVASIVCTAAFPVAGRASPGRMGRHRDHVGAGPARAVSARVEPAAAGARRGARPRSRSAGR